VYRTCFITAISNSAFSITGGFAVFSILGHVAHKEGVPVEEIATRSGTGLAFITIAEAMQYFGDLSNVMSVLFFVMLLTLGLDSAYAWLETVVSYVADFMEEYGYEQII
jgi:solute carrier family 6 amino acid transporter-like protein 5/7/9/14